LGALVRAASAKQLAIVGLVASGALLVLIDVTRSDTPADQPRSPAASGQAPAREKPAGNSDVGVEQPVSAPTTDGAENRRPSLIVTAFGAGPLVQFIGFSVLSMVVLAGVLALFWRLGRRSDP
jgi:hypothetical protein